MAHVTASWPSSTLDGSGAHIAAWPLKLPAAQIRNMFNLTALSSLPFLSVVDPLYSSVSLDQTGLESNAAPVL
jgi:hypothetical protein